LCHGIKEAIVSETNVGTVQRARAIYEDAEHRFIWLGAGDPAQESGIASNQYLIVDGEEGTLLDPGGFHVFERVLDNTLGYVRPEQIGRLFLSHQDPDICVSLVSWLEVRPDVEVMMSRLWERFIMHLALPVRPRMHVLRDEGEVETLPSGAALTYVPAHFLHSSGNFHVYDGRSRCLFTGDLGAALVPEDDTELFVTDFDAHVPLMESFHRRYMPCNAAVKAWLERVRHLEIDMICPQHGKLMRGADVGRFLGWLEGLDVGMDYRTWGG
jgi:flavorubredoxin